MSETLWARCIRSAPSESLIETQREEADNRQALWGQWKSHVSMWAFPDPGVRNLMFHNAVISLQNLNKPVILKLLLSTFSGKWLMPGLLECVPRRLSTWQNHRQIYELLSAVSSKVMFISSAEASTVCVIILILYSTEGNVLITKDCQTNMLCFPCMLKSQTISIYIFASFSLNLYPEPQSSSPHFAKCNKNSYEFIEWCFLKNLIHHQDSIRLVFWKKKQTVMYTKLPNRVMHQHSICLSTHTASYFRAINLFCSIF